MKQILLHLLCHIQVIAAQGDVLNKRALEAMPYADAVAREALRITPPAPQLFRRTLVNMQVRCDYTSQFLLTNLVDDCAWSIAWQPSCGAPFDSV